MIRGQKDGFRLGAGIFAQVVDEEPAIARIKPQREVVEHEQFGILRQNQPQRHLRTLAARHARNPLPGCDFQLAHQLVVGVAAPGGVEDRVELLDLFDGLELVLHVSLDQQADIAPQHGIEVLHLLPEDAAFAAAGFQVAAQDVDGRGLARTVLPQQPQNPPLRHVEAQVAVDQTPPVIMCQIATLDDCTHTLNLILRFPAPVYPERVRLCARDLSKTFKRKSGTTMERRYRRPVPRLRAPEALSAL